MKYKQLTQSSRISIYQHIKAGKNQSQIAVFLGVHKSTISRELKRNSGRRGYRIKQAQSKALLRQAYRFEARKMKPEMIKTILKHLEKDRWTPEQISNFLRVNKQPYVCQQTIYTYLAKDRQKGGQLYKNLPRSKRRKRRFSSLDGRGKLKNITSIHERPEASDSRSEIGHFERDTMFGKDRKSALLVINDQQSKLKKIQRNYSKN